MKQRLTTNSQLRRYALTLVLSLALGNGCSRGDAFEPIRFVDAKAKGLLSMNLGGNTQPLAAVATIDDDTRYVFAAPERFSLMYSTEITVPENGIVAINRNLPKTERIPERVLTVPRINVEKAWKDLPAVPSDVRMDTGGGPTVSLELELSAFRNRRVKLHVDAFAADWGTTQTYEPLPVDVPKNGVLSFSTGVLESVHNPVPCRFSVQACHGDQCEEVFEETRDPASRADRSWRNHKLELQQFAGQKIRFVFVSETPQAGSETIMFPVFANPTLFVPEQSKTRQPNLIFLSIDTLRADHLPTYGYAHDTAPFMDQWLGEQGTVFLNAVAAASSTSPSHMTMFTGLAPSTHGLTSGMEVLAPWISTMTEHIRAAGYETGAVTEDGWLSIRHGFGRGFDVYVENRSPNIMAPTGQVDQTFTRAVDWIRTHADQRFFLFLHTFQVHDPYAPPKEYSQLFVSNDDELVPATTTRHHREMVAYDQEIRYTDDQLILIANALEDFGIADDTLFIVTSDHGEAFLEHGFLKHSTHLHEPVTHIPLMMRGPGIVSGRRIEEVVGHRDLMPTILDLLDIDIPSYLPGRSLRALAAANPMPDPTANQPYFTESWGSTAVGKNHKIYPFYPPGFSVRLGSRKMARYGTKSGSYVYESYDLASDPTEQTNRAATVIPSQDRDLRELIDGYQEMAANAAELREQENSERQPSNFDRTTQLDPAQEEKLRALGYLE